VFLEMTQIDWGGERGLRGEGERGEENDRDEAPTIRRSTKFEKAE